MNSGVLSVKNMESGEQINLSVSDMLKQFS